MERLGINHGAYNGETIDIQSVIGEILSLSNRHGWHVDTIGNKQLPIFGLNRSRTDSSENIYISTGLHGDEPAGPLAILELLRTNSWPAHASICLCPCLNPTGFPLNRRENAQGYDLNRDYKHLKTEEIRAHVAWLEKQPPFQLCIGLHEDWEAKGFYLYEVRTHDRPSCADAIISEVSHVCPIDDSPIIDGRTAIRGVIRPNLDPATRPKWPEAFYLIQNKTQLSYTLEAPSDFPLAVRTRALTVAVQKILESL